MNINHKHPCLTIVIRVALVFRGVPPSAGLSAECYIRVSITVGTQFISRQRRHNAYPAEMSLYYTVTL